MSHQPTVCRSRSKVASGEFWSEDDLGPLHAVASDHSHTLCGVRFRDRDGVRPGWFVNHQPLEVECKRCATRRNEDE